MARFVLAGIRRRPDFDVRIISLATSSRDPASLLLTRPSTWLRGARAVPLTAHGEDYVHVGAVLGEIEVMRLSPRAVLADLVRGCDLIQVVAGVPSWISPVIGLGIPVVANVATLTDVERRRPLAVARGAKKVWRKLMTRLVARIEERVLRQVDAVMIMNSWMEAHCAARLPGGAACVQYGPPGLDNEQLRPLPTRDPAGGYILSVGRLGDPRKNVGLLLEAYAVATAGLASPPDLVLAGVGTLPQPFWDRVDALGLSSRVRHIANPEANELSELYRHAQTFALASDEEGFGIVVIEAMACGIPVVSTRSGGPDGIITEGKEGFLVDRDDVGALAARLRLLGEDTALNLAMGRCGLSTVEARYTMQAATDAYLAVYDKLLA